MQSQPQQRHQECSSSISDSLEKDGEVRVLTVDSWFDELRTSHWRWEPSGSEHYGSEKVGKVPFPVNQTDLEVPHSGTFLCDLPRQDILEAGGGGFSLELTLPIPPEGFAAGLFMQVGHEPQTANLLVSASNDAELSVIGRSSFASETTIFGEKKISSTEQINLRLELQPGGNKIAAYWRLNEYCLSLLGVVTVQKEAGKQAKTRVGLMTARDPIHLLSCEIPHKSIRFGSVKIDLLAAGRLVIGDITEPGSTSQTQTVFEGSGNRDSGDGVAGSTYSLGNSWTFSPDLSESERETIQEMFSIANIGAELTPKDEVCDQEANISPLSEWTISDNVTPDLHAQMKTLVDSAASSYYLQHQEPSESVPLGTHKWVISDTLNRKKRAQVLELLGISEQEQEK